MYVMIANSDANTSIPNFVLTKMAPGQILDYVKVVYKGVLGQ